jgi:hypothetical protein
MSFWNYLLFRGALSGGGLDAMQNEIVRGLRKEGYKTTDQNQYYDRRVYLMAYFVYFCSKSFLLVGQCI